MDCIVHGVAKNRTRLSDFITSQRSERQRFSKSDPRKPHIKFTQGT